MGRSFSRRTRGHCATKSHRQFHGAAVYQGLQTYAQGDKQHEMATFLLHDIPCTLLPGYQGELGYDPALHDLSYPVSPTEVAEHEERTEPTQVLIDRLLKPKRQVTLPPFLLATAAETLINRELLPDGHWQYTGVPIRRSETLAHIAEAGFRFPSSDEWEYACSGGARNSFVGAMNGHHCACARRKSAIVRGGPRMCGPTPLGSSSVKIPTSRNTARKTISCVAATGAAAIHAGLGYFKEWLGFATSFRWRWLARFVEITRRG